MALEGKHTNMTTQILIVGREERVTLPLLMRKGPTVYPSTLEGRSVFQAIGGEI